MLSFDKNNILINLSAENSDEAIKKIVEVMEQNGYVKNKYYMDVIEREKTFPTGLPTEGVKVAIPHANSDAVVSSGVAIALLDKPVVFKNMANPDEKIDVEMVFLLANANVSEQVKDIQALMSCFSDVGTLLKIRNSATPEEILNTIKKITVN